MSNLTDALIAAKLVGGSGGSGGGSGLPEVTADDNGDILTVVDGAWGKATPSSGGGVFVVQLSSEPTTEYTALPTGITYAKIVEAIKSGKIPMLRYGDASTGRLIPFSAYSPNGKWVYFRTFSNQISSGTITGVMLESYIINYKNKIKKESGVLSFDNGGGK